MPDEQSSSEAPASAHGPTTSMPLPLPGWQAILLLALCYFVAAYLGLALQLPGTNASPVWPPTGIAFAALLGGGLRLWPGIALGAFAANFLVFPADLALSLKLTASAAISCGNTLESLAGVFILRAIDRTRLFGATRNIGRFFATVLVMCAISATVGALSVCGLVIGSFDPLRIIWLTWWLGDVAGALVLTPPLLLWFAHPKPALRRRPIESVGGILALVGIVHIIFGRSSTGLVDSLTYLLVVGPLWSAIRLQARHTSLTVLAIATVAVMHPMTATGPFFVTEPGSPLAQLDAENLRAAIADPGRLPGLASELSLTINDAFLMLQIFVCTLCVVGLVLSAAVAERDRSSAALESLNGNLEARVRARTRELEQTLVLLQERGRELQRSNTALDEFAHAASHDLRSPLRAIAVLSEWIADDQSNQLSPQSKKDLETLRLRITRMDALLQGMLDYALVGRDPHAGEAVEIRRVLASVVPQIAGRRGVRIVIGERLPAALVERHGCTRVLRNLIENAVHHHDCEAGRVEISARKNDEGMIEFCVSDDGPGIDPRYHERVFVMFQTLSARDEMEGGGIGLALVRKIVELHGGRVWLDSELGTGTRIHFTWPVVIDEPRTPCADENECTAKQHGTPLALVG